MKIRLLLDIGTSYFLSTERSDNSYPCTLVPLLLARCESAFNLNDFIRLSLIFMAIVERLSDRSGSVIPY